MKKQILVVLFALIGTAACSASEARQACASVIGCKVTCPCGPDSALVQSEWTQKSQKIKGSWVAFKRAMPR